MLKGILQTILLIWLIYYTLRVVFRYVFPWLLAKYVQHIQKNMYSAQNPSSGNRRPPGQVTVEPNRETPKAFSSEDGEYVDFEEIKEKN